MVPVENKIAYYVRGVITRVVDYQDFLKFNRVRSEYYRWLWPPPRPAHRRDCEPAWRSLSGVLDINASDKASRFIRFSQ